MQRTSLVSFDFPVQFSPFLHQVLSAYMFWMSPLFVILLETGNIGSKKDCVLICSIPTNLFLPFRHSSFLEEKYFEESCCLSCLWRKTSDFLVCSLSCSVRFFQREGSLDNEGEIFLSASDDLT